MKPYVVIIGAIVLVLIGAGILSAYYRTSLETVAPVTQSTATVRPTQSSISGIVVPSDVSLQAQRSALLADVKQKDPSPSGVILVTTEDAATIEADIKEVFPKATISAVAMTPENFTQQHDALQKSCANCLVVAAIDFSQNQPALLANLHDKLALRALQNRDTAALLKDAEVDSPAALAFLAQWAESHNTKKFVVKEKINSGEVAKDGDIAATTHILGWYENGDPVVPETSVSFVLGGDMMYGRNVRHIYGATGLTKLFANLGDRTFWGADARVANLEGPLSEVAVPDDWLSTSLIFNFSPETLDALKYLKLNAVSLANNHTDNKGAKGLASTHKLLEAADIQAIGGPYDSDVPKVVTFKGQNLDLTIIGVHAVFTNPNIIATVKEQAAKPNNKVLVFPHWGQEYKPNHSGPQEALAHAWIDAGADLVIGAHPHVIQDAEVYKGVPIFYSLGNFIFDQYFSPETQQGLFIAGEFTDKDVRVFALPIQGKKSQVSLVTGATKKQILTTLYVPLAAFKEESAIGDTIIVPQ